MALYGGCVFGPAATTWYKILQRHVNVAGRPNATIAARVAADQLVFAPVFIGVFLSSMALLEGGSPRAKLRRSYKDALTANYMLWPAAQGVNFKLVPLEHRVLFVNVVSIGWNCYLSYLNSAK
jgi:protein Mpv17